MKRRVGRIQKEHEKEKVRKGGRIKNTYFYYNQLQPRGGRKGGGQGEEKVRRERILAGKKGGDRGI